MQNEQAKPSIIHRIKEHFLGMETIREQREVVRVIALQLASPKEIREHMLPDVQTIHAYAAQPDADMTTILLDTTAATPMLTRSIWILKGGKKSNNQIMLPGGGVDSDKPTMHDVMVAGATELLQETGHTVSMVHFLENSERTYHLPP